MLHEATLDDHHEKGQCGILVSGIDLESSSFDTLGLQEVVVGVERHQLGGERRKPDEPVVRERQFLQ